MALPTRRVFLSHAYDDAALRLCRTLVMLFLAAELDYWYDEHNLAGGADIAHQIISELRASTDFVVVVSPAALESLYVLGESFLALNLQQSGAIAAMIPILAQPVTMPPLLAARLYIDAPALGAEQTRYKLLQALGFDDAASARVFERLRRAGLSAAEQGRLATLPLVAMLDEVKRRLRPPASVPPLWLPAGQFNARTAVFALAWSPDGQRLVTGTQDQLLRIWDATTLHDDLTLRGHTHYIDNVAWSPNGRYLVSASVGRVIRLWDVAAGSEVRTFAGHSATVRSVAWSPDGLEFISGSEDGTAIIWNLARGTARLTLRVAPGHKITSVDWAPATAARPLVGAAATDALLYLWDATAGGDPVMTLKGHHKTAYCLRWSHNGRFIASSGETTVKLWEPAQHATFIREYHGHTGQITQVAWRRDDAILASGSADRTVRLWGMGSEHLVVDGGAFGDWVHCVAWSPDGQTLAAGGGMAHPVVKLWRPATA